MTPAVARLRYRCISFVIQGADMAVSLRVPENVKRRVAKLAAEQDTTPHAFMLEAILLSRASGNKPPRPKPRKHP